MRSSALIDGLVPRRWRDYSFTHIVEPGDDLGFGCGVGPDVAVEVDVVALSDVGRHQAAPQLDRNNRRICKQRVFSFEYETASSKIHRNRFHDRPARGRPRQEILIITEESYNGIGILTDCSFSLELKEGGRGRLPRISFGGQVLSLKYLAAKTIQTTSKRRHGLRVGNNGPRSALSLRDPPSPYISSSRAVQPSNYYFSGAFVSPLSRLRPRVRDRPGRATSADGFRVL